MQLKKCRFFSVAHGFQLDNGVTSPGLWRMASMVIKFIIAHFKLSNYLNILILLPNLFTASNVLAKPMPNLPLYLSLSHSHYSSDE